MNKYELVYDLKEHLDTYCQTYDDYIMSYGEANMIYHYIVEKDKEILNLKNELASIWEYKARNDDAIEYIKKGIDFNSLHFIAGKDEDMWKILLVDNVKEDLLEILGDKENE